MFVVFNLLAPKSESLSDSASINHLDGLSSTPELLIMLTGFCDSRFSFCLTPLTLSVPYLKHEPSCGYGVDCVEPTEKHKPKLEAPIQNHHDKPCQRDS